MHHRRFAFQAPAALIFAGWRPEGGEGDWWEGSGEDDYEYEKWDEEDPYGEEKLLEDIIAFVQDKPRELQD